MKNCIIIYKITPNSIQLYYELDNNEILKWFFVIVQIDAQILFNVFIYL